MKIIGFDPEADFETIHFRHHHIQKTDVDPLRSDFLQRFRAIHRQDHIISPRGEHGLQQAEIERFVIHANDSLHTLIHNRFSSSHCFTVRV